MAFPLHEDYRDILREELAARTETNPQYSLRAFARDLGIGSARLSEVLNGNTGLSRPAAEPLSPGLHAKFGDPVAVDRIKQMTGHMIRQLLENRGYRLDQSGVRITRKGNIFSSATRYSLSA